MYNISYYQYSLIIKNYVYTNYACIIDTIAFSIMCIINNNVLFAALVPPFARVNLRDTASGSGR